MTPSAVADQFPPVGARRAVAEALPPRWQRYMAAVVHGVEVGRIDEMLRADALGPQATGADPSPNCLGIAPDPAGRLGDGQHS